MPLLLLLAGCAFVVRTEKFLGAEEFVSPAHEVGHLADVRYATGWKDDEEGPYAPRDVEIDGRLFTEPIEITSHGFLTVAPTHKDATLSVWVRSTGLFAQDFTQIKSLTGGIDRNIASEVRFLPEHLDAPLTLQMHQLHNVYNDFSFSDGDLLMVEVAAPDELPERYMFRSRHFGPRTKVSGGLLFRVPFPFSEEEQQAALAPALMLTFSMGYRFRSQNAIVRWGGDRLALVASGGVGSTALVTTPNTEVRNQLKGVFNAALGGGGVELYDFLSVQLLQNLSSLGRDKEEAAITMAIGFDAVQFGQFTRDAGTRLFKKNEL